MDLLNEVYDKPTCLGGNKIESLDLSFLTDDFLKNIILNGIYSDELCSKIISLPNYIAESMDNIPSELFFSNYIYRLISVACHFNEDLDGKFCLNNFQLKLLFRLFRSGFGKMIVNHIASPLVLNNTDVSRLCLVIHQLSLELDDFHLKKFVTHILEAITPLYKIDKDQFYTHISTFQILEQFKSFNFTTIFHPLNSPSLVPSLHLLDFLDNKIELCEYLLCLWSDESLNSMLPSSSQIKIGACLTRLLYLHIKNIDDRYFDLISSGIHWRLSSFENCARLSGISMAIVIKKLSSTEEDVYNNDDKEITFEEFECPQSNILRAAIKDFNHVIADKFDCINTCDDELKIVKDDNRSIRDNYSLSYQKSHISKPFYLRQILENIQGNIIRGDVDFELVKNLPGGSSLDKIEDYDHKMRRIIQALNYLPVILDKNPPDAELESLSIPVAQSLISLTATYDLSQKLECLHADEGFEHKDILNYSTKIVTLSDLIYKGLSKLILVSFKQLIKWIANELFNIQLSAVSRILLVESAIDAVGPKPDRTFKNINPNLAVFGVSELVDAIERFINSEKSYSNITHLTRANKFRFYNIDSTGIILIARTIDLIVCLKISSGNGWNLLGSQTYQIDIKLEVLRNTLTNCLPSNCRLMESLSLLKE